MDETSQLAREDSCLPFSLNKVIFKLDEPALMASIIWDESAMAHRRGTLRSQLCQLVLLLPCNALISHFNDDSLWHMLYNLSISRINTGSRYY